MLLGRDRELRQLAALLEGARAGRSGVLALVGEVGIGKSSLLAWTAEHAGGMNVLRARGVQSEAHIPFAGLHELLRPALARLDALPAPQAAALESALALRPARAHDRFAVGAATLNLLAAHAESGPLAVLVDDAHWLDGSSADALRFALRRFVADPIAVVLAVRAGEPSLLDGADFATLRLGALEAAAAAELVLREAPSTSAEDAGRLHRETGGNPLALLELARRPLPDVPLETPLPAATSVSAAYLSLARALPARTRALLVLAAANDGGEAARLARAASTLGLDLRELAPAEERGLVSVAGERVEFRHPLTRSAIYGDAPPAERRAAHRALAAALPDSEVDRRAWHLALAAVGPDGAASSALEQAGSRARDRSAYDVASRAFERAARLAEEERRRAFLFFAAADAAWLAGAPERARSLLDEAERSGADERLRVELRHLRGRIALLRGPVAEGRATLVAVAEQAAAEAPEAAVVMLADAAEGAFFAGDADGMRACGERARELAATLGGSAAFVARIAAGMGRVFAGADGGAAMIRDAVALLEGSDALTEDTRLLAWAATGPLWLREAGAGQRLAERALEAARDGAAVGVLPHLLAQVGIQQAATDRLAEAEATFDEAVRLARETGQRTILAGLLARLALVEARSGRDAASRAHAGEALELARPLGAHLFEIWALTALGELELVRGDAEAALAWLEEQQATVLGHGIADADLSPAPELVELRLRQGRRDAAVLAAEPFLAAAAAKRQPWALARAARCRALLAGEDGFEREFDEALAQHARTPDVFETARTELAYGARLRREGRRLRARERLRAALDTFDRLGAAAWGELARAELAATGETARRRDPSTLDELTPQELKIARLLAGGKTTREAAAALFLSPKTIEYHLRNAYRKLGVNSREQLAAELARGG